VASQNRRVLRAVPVSGVSRRARRLVVVSPPAVPHRAADRFQPGSPLSHLQAVVPTMARAPRRPGSSKRRPRNPDHLPRATKQEMAERRDTLYEIVAQAPPMTVRQVLYQAVVRGLMPKTKEGYNAVDRTLVYLRESGRMPFEWIVDPTRRALGEAGYKGRSVAEKVADALADLEPERHFRGLWHGLDVYVEVWCEKDALTGVIEQLVISEYDSKLMVHRGYSSSTFLHQEAAKEIAERSAPTFIFYLRDYDPSGKNAAEVAERKLCASCVAIPTPSRSQCWR
jgi:hypothetical protein